MSHRPLRPGLRRGTTRRGQWAARRRSARRARLEDRARVLVEAFGPYHPPELRRWPLRAVYAALLLPRGRRHLYDRFLDWTILPGDRWQHFQRDIIGTVVSVRGRGLERVVTLELDPSRHGEHWRIIRNGFAIYGVDHIGPPQAGSAEVAGPMFATGWTPTR